MFGRFNAYFRGSSKIYDVNSYVETDEFILFMYQQGFMNDNAVIIHKKTGQVELVKDFSKDLIFKDGKNHFFGGFVFSDTKGAYEILHTMSIADFQESIRNNEVIPELDKTDELLKLEEDANPIIFYYEYK